ncbi:glycosyltransferase [Rariglobus hedericola]|uniref:Glycosyltransferase n=1 Tax=Rariglobus hedericola TaxID=2597822 RepID=A0A556QPW4_9BACT|nr:glycosyltransferase [Rariglobus hedericola]TSJ78688.1 glycosyltransferase [Rariglobus hedericola]
MTDSSRSPREPLFLFYEEPDPDRWFPGDRHIRRFIRRLVRGPHKPGGVMRWYLNLRAGLDQLGVTYRVNDYRGLRRTPGAWAHVIGQHHVINKIPAGHPIVYGPAIADHPRETSFFGQADIRLLLIPCAWFKAMYDRDLAWSGPRAVWPAGVDVELWHPPATTPPSNEVLLYDKIHWDRDRYEPELLNPIIQSLTQAGMKIHHMRYGFYKEEDFRDLLKRIGSMVFLCEHETQGFAYLQTLSSGVPILAWDRGGLWQDPNYYPALVEFEPVCSVPYFDERCGERFKDFTEFHDKLPAFLDSVRHARYQPRAYVTENLTLAGQSAAYLKLSQAAMHGDLPSPS